MATEKLKIFISYAWEDKPLVRRLEKDLQAAGLETTPALHRPPPTSLPQYDSNSVYNSFRIGSISHMTAATLFRLLIIGLLFTLLLFR